LVPLEFGPTARAEQEQVVDFLVSAFQADRGAQFVDPALLDWKYYAARPDWTGSRSHTYKQNGKIVAHGCAWPLTLLCAGRAVTSMRVIDWAASRAVPGSGAAFMKKMSTLTRTLLAVGGSVETKRVLPGIGFKVVGYCDQYARVVRPWEQFRGMPSKNWKSPARLARNTWWSLQPLSATPPEWRAERISGFEDLTLPGFFLAGPVTASSRDAPTLNYMLQCPMGNLTAYLIYRCRDVMGYFITSRMAGQTRITDLRLVSADQADWTAAYSLASRTAAAHPETCELMTIASADFVRSALESNHYRLRRHEPVFLYDPEGRLAGAAPLHLSLLDGDEFFLYYPQDPYLT
jgi:hypothetical protein